MYDPFAAVMPTAVRPPVVFVSGEGSWLEDEQGRRYLDFVQGWAVNALGHRHPALVRALCEQADRLINCSPAFYSRPMVDLADRLARLSGFDHVFLANSGAEANEGAIKLARKWGAMHRNGAYEIITTHNGFHGRTLATMSASGKAGWDRLFEPKVPGFRKVPFNDLAAIAAAIDDRTVAVMLEPVQGEAGVIPAERDYLHGLRELTRERGILLIFDEVQTGIGRLGELFGFQLYGVEPDLLTLGKGLGGGVPAAALLARRAFSCFEPGDQGGTFNGNPLVAAAAGAVLEVVAAPGFLATVQSRGESLRTAVAKLSKRFGLGPVRGHGLLLALDTGPLSAEAVCKAAFERGLLVNAPRPNLLRFMPALTVTEAEIAEMSDRLAAAISAARQDVQT